jgi:hypothetical protein
MIDLASVAGSQHSIILSAYRCDFAAIARTA